jgi:hypothetical protein
MDLDTVFKPSLNDTLFTLDETYAFIKKHKTEEVLSFAEELEIRFNENQFYLVIDNEAFLFTRDSFMEFCTLLGISKTFANKIPNDLLLQCIEKMISTSMTKIRFEVRDKNVIAQCKKETFSRIDPHTFFQEADPIFLKSKFREANIGDSLITMLVEPNGKSTIQVANDPFEIGIEFRLSLGKSLLEARPYSLRHACTNIASSYSKTPRNNLVQRLSTKTQGSYNRLIDSCEDKLFDTYKEELSTRIEECMKASMTEFDYCTVFNNLKPLLGVEVALALLNTDKFRHAEIMAEVKAKYLREETTVVPLEDFSKWDCFNSVTAAGKGYTGEERIFLEEIGGMLV